MSATVPASGDLERAAQAGPATEAWALMLELAWGKRPAFPTIAAELDLSPMQAKVLHLLGPGVERPMSGLAEGLACDASNVTGLVDRLETRGLVERRPAEHDRRVKLLAATRDGLDLRERLVARLHEPHEAVGRLSKRDQRALRDVLRRAVELSRTP